MLNQYMKQELVSPLRCVVFVTGSFAILECILTCILSFSKKPAVILCALPVLLSVCALLLLTHSIHFSAVAYDRLLSFSCTRKRALRLFCQSSIRKAVLLWSLTWIYTSLEREIMPPLWAATKGLDAIRFEALCIPEGSILPPGILFAEPILFPWWVTPAVLIGSLAAGLLFGALIRRFTGTALAICYGIWLVGCMTISMWYDFYYLHRSVILPLIAAAFLAGLIWAIRELLRTPIRWN